MQEKYKSCFRFFKELENTYGRSLTEDEKQLVYNSFDEARINIIKNGKTMEGLSTVEIEIDTPQGKGKRFLTNFEAEFKEQINKRQVEGIISRYTSKLNTDREDALLGKIMTIKDNIMTLGNVDEATATRRAIIGSRVETNDTIGTVTPDKMYRSDISTYVGDYRRAADDAIRRIDAEDTYDNVVKTENNNIWTEWYAFEINAAHTNPVTNAKAYAVAKAIRDATTVRHNVFMSAVKPRYQRLRQGVKIVWDKTKVSKMARDQFINELAPRLDPNIHATRTVSGVEEIIPDGNQINVLREIAGQVYDQIQEPGFNWRTVGDVSYNKKITMRSERSFGKTEAIPGLAYKSPEDFVAIKKLFTEDAKFDQSMLTYVTEIGREKTIHKLFGSDPRQGLQKYINAVENLGNPGTGIQRAQMESSLNFLKYLVQPELLEKSKGTIAFNVLRNIQAGAKLGSAVITALLDIPTFIVGGSRVFGLDPMDMIQQLFPGKKFNGSLAENKRYAEYIIEAAESLQDSASLRYILNDGIGTPTRIQRGAATFANFIFKASGLSWWTKSLQSSAAGVYGKHIGELVLANKSWDEISKNPVFVRNWQKYGIGKAEWEDLLQRHKNTDGGILDARNRLDLYKMGETQDELLRIPLRQKFSAAIGDAVDTMVMKPGQFDRMSAALFADEQSFHGNVFKTILQFKAHPITLFRKIYVRGYKQDRAGLIETSAYLMTSLMLFGTMVTQLKEFVAGRQPLDPLKPDLYIKGFQQAGVVGIASDMVMLLGGQKILEEAFLDEKAKAINQYDALNQLIGPLLGDIMKLQSSGGGMIQGGFRMLKGKDSGEMFWNNAGELIKLIVGQAGFQNLWQTRLLYRGAISEPWLEFTDPKGYRRRERKAYQDARKQRLGGEKDNFIFRKLFD